MKGGGSDVFINVVEEAGESAFKYATQTAAKETIKTASSEFIIDGAKSAAREVGKETAKMILATELVKSAVKIGAGHMKKSS